MSETPPHPYGEMARKHWAKWRPNQLSQIPDPETFFFSLGQEVESQIEVLAAALAGDDPGGEDYLEKVGRLRMARFTAEGQILRVKRPGFRAPFVMCERPVGRHGCERSSRLRTRRAVDVQAGA